MPLFLLNDPKVLFIHIPKTGGYAIRDVMFKGQYSGPFFENTCDPDWHALFAFAFVRNPFDRAVSAWKMFTQGTENSTWQLPPDHDPDLTLRDALQLGLDPAAGYGHPRFNGAVMTMQVRLKNHILPQTHPYYQLDRANFIGRFETYTQSLKTIFDKLGLDFTAPDVAHYTRRDHYRSYYDDETIAMAKCLYHDDLMRFGYEF